MPVLPALLQRDSPELSGLKVAGESHSGLWWQRWLPCWIHDRGSMQVDKSALVTFAREWKPNVRGLARMNARLDALVQHEGGAYREVKAVGRLVFGTGAASHPIETSMTFDPALGQPVIPGSSLKGAARAFALLVGVEPERVAALFGVGPGEEGGESAGAIVFLDAWPLAEGLSLDVDLLNPHEPGYYRALESAGEPPEPLGTDNPVPVQFLAVCAGARYRIRLLPRHGRVTSSDLDQALDLLLAALDEVGIGAKTAAGYGRLSSPRPAPWGWWPTDVPAKPAGDGAPAGSRTASSPVLPRRPWRFAWVNGTQDPPRNEARRIVPQVTVGAQLPDAELAPRPMFKYSDVGEGKVRWPQVAQRVDALTESVIPTEGWHEQGPLVFVCGIAPQPLFLRLGARLGRFAVGHVQVLHPEPSKPIVRFDPAVGDAAFFGPPEVSTFGEDASRPVVLSVSTKPLPPTEEQFAELAPGGLAGRVHLGSTEDRFLPQHAARALSAIESAARTARNQWPAAQKLVVVVNGPTALGVIAGMGVNVELWASVAFPAFVGGRYVHALS